MNPPQETIGSILVSLGFALAAGGLLAATVFAIKPPPPPPPTARRATYRSR